MVYIACQGQVLEIGLLVYFWQLETYTILPGLHSDHSILTINLGNKFHNRSKGFWKFHTTLLHDTKYVKKVKTIIKDSENDYLTMQDRALAWKMIKLKIRTFSVPYCVKKKKR